MLKKFLIPLFLIFIVSCDFTPIIYKKILKAQNYIKDQKYSAAIDEYKEILKKNPSLDIKVKILFQIGELYSISLSEYGKSIEYYKKIKEISAEDPFWLVKSEERLADVSFSFINDYKTSINSYKSLLNFVPRLKDADFYQYRLGLSNYHLSSYDNALNIFKEISSINSHKYNRDSFFYLGLIFFHQKKWSISLNYWKEYLKNENRKDLITKTKFLMANAYESMEDLKRAYNLYYSILGEYPNTKVLQNRLKSIYERRIARKR